jgi:hypothetical protein
MTPKPLELVPDQQTKAKPLFETEAAYLEFRASYQTQMKADLDKQREARRLSEEEAKHHLVY